MRRSTSLPLANLVAVAVIGTMAAPSASGDAAGYLLNVTVRPGYNFTSPEDALTYGNGICDKVARARSYADLIADVKTEFDTRDDYQGSYLITQAVNELCPESIWQLRNSAAHYRPPTP